MRGSQLTFAEVAAERDRQLERVERAADDAWKALANHKLYQYLRSHRTMFVDDWWDWSEIEQPREARALGPIILAAARNRWIRKSGQYRPSKRSHLTEKPVWESLIYNDSVVK